MLANAVEAWLQSADGRAGDAQARSESQMPAEQLQVTFQPCGRVVFVLEGTTVLEAAGRAGLTLDTPCGGQGTCGKCRVRLTQGAGKPTVPEGAIFSADELADGWRLACQTRLTEPAVVEVSPTSLFASQHQILAEARTAEAEEVLPAVRKVHLELPPASLEDNAPDLVRIQRALGPVRAELGLLRQLGRRLREGGFQGTAVVTDHDLIDFEPGDTTGECFGAAFDVGTTTVVGALVDLTTGDEVAVESRMNAQVRFGDDVLSRIQQAGDEGRLEALRSAIAETVSEMLGALCEQSGVPRARIYEITFSGNTTMQHLLCGIDPSQLGRVPFVPAFGRALIVPARELGIEIHPRGQAAIFPVIGGFVGGDTVAGMLATRLAEQDAAALMVDIGTNGEIVLACGEDVSAASTAAGPAFEGARISCGMRATTGAIEKIVFDGDVRWSVIGAAEPVGLCGSALVDLAAELLRSGIVTSGGRMLPPEELPASLPDALRRRVSVGDGGQPLFRLVRPAGEGSPGVALTQKDVRELQLATGAIRAGIHVLLEQAGLGIGDLELVLVAGGFGSFIRRSNAQRIGLLPPGIDHRRIHYVGNVSLRGAKWALVSTKARRRAEELARLVRHVQLSQDPAFQEAFAEAMVFPAE
jgi:uncharacterized 2Fe-2S/4Fe-4S cluster protein (DUF4445 family)